MRLSTERIVTTHVGSLPRPRPMLDLAQQVACGIDIVSDDEQSKPSYATYVKHRIAGIDMDPSVIERGRDVMLSLYRLGK
ncbi:MAG TPA: hypothetical protein VFQ90_10135 [Stellaceae bacterium]|nr:hypothetical protein [Stellaceae bacterium]